MFNIISNMHSSLIVSLNPGTALGSCASSSVGPGAGYQQWELGTEEGFLTDVMVE